MAKSINFTDAELLNIETGLEGCNPDGAHFKKAVKSALRKVAAELDARGYPRPWAVANKSVS